jgi:hypothetical protein
MERRTPAGRTPPNGDLDVDWVPRPKQDIDHPFFDLTREHERLKRALARTEQERVSYVRSKDSLIPAFRKSEWPVRNPIRNDAQIGDVLAGNVELRANCRCGHSATVDPAVLADKFDAKLMLYLIEDRVRCTQCGRYGSFSLHYPRASPLNYR